MKKLLENFRKFINEYEEDPEGLPDLELGLDPSQDIEYWKEKEPTDEPQMYPAAPADIAPLPFAPEDWSTSFHTRAGVQAPSKDIVTEPVVVDMRPDARPELPPLRGPEGDIIASPETAKAAMFRAGEAPVTQDPSLDYSPTDMSVVPPEKPEEFPPDLAAQILPDFDFGAQPKVAKVQTPDAPVPSAQPAPDVAVGGGDMPMGSPGRYTKTPPPPKMPSAADTQAALAWAAQYSQAEKAGKEMAPAPPEGLSDDDAQAALDWARAQDPQASGLDPEGDLEQALDLAKDVADQEIGPEPEPEEWEDYGPPGPEEPSVAEPEKAGEEIKTASRVKIGADGRDFDVSGDPNEILGSYFDKVDPETGKVSYRGNNVTRTAWNERSQSRIQKLDNKIKAAEESLSAAKRDPDTSRSKLKSLKKALDSAKWTRKNDKYGRLSTRDLSQKPRRPESDSYVGLDLVETLAAKEDLGPGFVATLVDLAAHESGGKLGKSGTDWVASYGIFGTDNSWYQSMLKRRSGNKLLDSERKTLQEAGIEEFITDKSGRKKKNPDFSVPGFRKSDGGTVGGKLIIDTTPEELTGLYIKNAAMVFKRVKETGGDDIDAFRAIKLQHRSPSYFWANDTNMFDQAQKKGWKEAYSEWENVGSECLDPSGKGKSSCKMIGSRANWKTEGYQPEDAYWGSWGGSQFKLVPRTIKQKKAGVPARPYITGKVQGQKTVRNSLLQLGYSVQEATDAAISGELPDDYSERSYQRVGFPKEQGKRTKDGKFRTGTGILADPVSTEQDHKSWINAAPKQQLAAAKKLERERAEKARMAAAYDRQGGGARDPMAPGGPATFRESKMIYRDQIREIVLEAINKRKKPQLAGRDLIRDIVVNAIRNRKS